MSAGAERGPSQPAGLDQPGMYDKKNHAAAHRNSFLSVFVICCMYLSANNIVDSLWHGF